MVRRTLEDWQKHFQVLYGRRNRIFLPDRRSRIDFLNLAIGDLQDAIRKKLTSSAIEMALARVVARVFCIAESFWSASVTKGMARKYGNVCPYCQSLPCLCSERRRSPVIYTENHQTVSACSVWTLSNWCRHLKALYNSQNKKKDLEYLLTRLFKEIAELQSLEVTKDHLSSLKTIEEEFELELADTLAWTIALSNLLKKDLEKCVFDRFGENCWNCHKKPCECTAFSHFQVDWLKWEKENK